MNEKIEALRYLFGCYFHVDWTLEYDSDDPHTTIDDFLREDYSIIVETYEAITWLLNLNLEDKQLQEFFDDQVGEYYFFFEGKANSFLRDIRIQLATGGQSRENLEEFFGGYLHQNFHDFHATPTEAVEEFLSEYPPDDATRILTSLGWLLDQQLSEERLRSLLRELDNAYYPPGIGKTYKQWLIELYNQIAESLGKPPRN